MKIVIIAGVYMRFIIKDLYFIFGEIIYVFKSYNLALKCFLSAFKVDTKDLDVLYYIICCYYYMGDIDCLEFYCDKYLELDESKHNIFYFKGLVYSERENYEDALKFYNKALKIFPNSIYSLINKASVLLKLKQDDLFLETTDKILELDPLNFYALANKGCYYFRHEDYVSALEYTEKALEEEPDNVDALFNKAQVLFALEHFEESLDAFNLLLEYVPDCVSALKVKTIILKDMSKFDRALETINEILYLTPDDEESLRIKEFLENKVK